MSNETKYAKAAPAGDLAALRNLREEQLRRGDVNELRFCQYREAMAGWVLKLQQELDALEGVDPSLRQHCGKILADFPPHDLDPRPVRNVVSQLRNVAGGAQRVLTEHPRMVRGLLKKIQGRVAGDFRDVTSETMIDIDIREVRPLLGCARSLEPVREEIENLKAALEAASQAALLREQQGAPPPLRLEPAIVLPKDQGEKIEAVRSVRKRHE